MKDRRKILDMVAEGKISDSEAAKLLAALDEPVAKKGKKFVVLVTREGSTPPKLKIALPISVVKLAAGLIPVNSTMNAKLGESRFDFSQVNWKELFALAAAGEMGDLFYADVEEDNSTVTTVRVYVE